MSKKKQNSTEQGHEVALDAYDIFFAKFKITKDEFFKFGLDNTIYAPKGRAEKYWEELKQRIKNNEAVHIRKYGMKPHGNKLFIEFYKNVFGNENVQIDIPGNIEPGRIFPDMTGYSRVENSRHKLIKNYQISHIFGKTKNVYAFTAPWNMAYTPKVIDPFTGNETYGDWAKEYRVKFQQNTYSRFKSLIEDYNEIITNPTLRKRIEMHLEKIYDRSRSPKVDIQEQRSVDKWIKAVREELTPISV